MNERLVMRFEGGPLAGDRIMERDWPLPDVLPAPDASGYYVKTGESQLPRATPGVLRGAEYRWVDGPERPA